MAYEQIMTNKNHTISIAKGIGITLMVIAHAIVSGYLHNFIYLFHMPLFFFVSGYFFKKEYLDNKLEFCKRRAKGLYVPFMMWGLIFLFLHNVFFHLNIYSSVYGYNGVVSYLYALPEFFIKSVRVMLFSHSEQLLGTYWFLQSLFGASIFYLVFMSLLAKQKGYFTSAAIICVISLSISILFAYTGWRKYMFSSATFFAVSSYAAGNIFRKYESRLPYNCIGLIGSFCLMIIGVLTMPVMSVLSLGGHICLVPLYFVVSCIGTYMVLSISYLMRNFTMGKILAYIGDRTIFIMTFHLLAFKVVSYVYVRSNNLPLEQVAFYPVIPFTCKRWYLLISYPLVGIVLPLLVEYVIGIFAGYYRKTLRNLSA